MEQLLEFMREDSYKPLTITELEEVFELKDSSEFKQFVKTLNYMEEQGLIVRTRTNRFGVPERMGLIKGRVKMNAKGFAFVIPEEEGFADIYISQNDMNGAMNGDLVLVRPHLTTSGTSQEGSVVRIIERGITQTVGTYVDEEYYGIVIADDKRIPHDIFIPKSASKGAAEGHKVVVAITKYPEGRQSAEGEIIEILGHKNDPGIDILSIIHKYGIPIEFPDDVLEQAEKVPDTISEEEIANRRDLRDKTIVTIDGADAKDLDDAVTVERLDNGNYLLGVYIADVSYYVPEDSPIDREAFERGTSVYLVDRVIPMIPHRLSNGICSLNPKVDRLVLACEMEITSEGQVVNHEIFEGVIRTTERMTYSDVRKILVEQDEEEMTKYAELVPLFQLMEELALILRKKRFERGAIDFDFKEAKVLVNEEGIPTDVVIRERTIAENIIEEFMLAANETIAEHFHWMRLPFLYRIHEEPKTEKLEQFLQFITNFGYVVRGTANTVHPRALQMLLEEVRGEPEETVISTVMLRSMQQAKYDPNSLGHFGLSTEFYTHFTSPIRRYPDLIVHRLIRTYLIENKIDQETQNYWNERLGDIARHTSEMERRAVDAERDTDEVKKAQFMENKIGEVFTGIISGVTNFGIFVELENTIEGLVHVSHLTDDYYHYDERQYAMIGERTGNVFRIGDVIEVRCIDVNVEESSIDFEIVGMKPKKRRERRESPKVIVGGKRNSIRQEPSAKHGDRKKKKKKFYENAPSNKRKKGKRR